MRRFTLAGLAYAVFAAGCETGDVDAELARLREENAALKDQIKELRAESSALRKEITGSMREAVRNAGVTAKLRSELDDIRRDVAARGRPPEKPTDHPILVDPEIEERLFHKVEELRESVWELSPSGCVRVLRQIVERYPNTRAALRAENVLADWDVRGVEVTGENAAETDDSIRGLLRARSGAWRRIQEAKRAAEAGQAETAVRWLREIAEEHGGEPARHAREILESWGAAEADPDLIDFAALGPVIRDEAAAQRQIEAAFRSLHKGRLEAAAKAFRKVIRDHSHLRQAERAREGLEDVEAELRERRQERAREREEEFKERLRGKGRRVREGEVEERRERERRRDDREAEGREAEEREAEPEREKPRQKDRRGEEGEKKNGAPVF